MRAAGAGPGGCGPDGGHDERGSVTVFVLGVVVVLLAVAGLVVDGGAAVNARQRAVDDAGQAARAAAQEVAFPADGTVSLQAAAAATAARGFLVDRGYASSDVTVSVAGGTVTVTASLTRRTALLSLVHLDSYTVTGTGTARLAVGVTGELG